MANLNPAALTAQAHELYDPCPSCDWHNGFHQFYCETNPVAPTHGEHHWVAIRRDPVASCLWCRADQDGVAAADPCHGTSRE